MIFIGNQAQFMALSHQTDHRIVFPKDQAVLRPGREHPVRLINTACHQIIDHDAHIGIGTIEDKRRSSLNSKGSINSRPEPLCGGFFITGGPIDLACQI